MRPGLLIVTLNSAAGVSPSLLVNGLADPSATWAEAGSWKGLASCLRYVLPAQLRIRWGNPADGMNSAKAGHILTFVLRTIWILAGGSTSA